MDMEVSLDGLDGEQNAISIHFLHEHVDLRDCFNHAHAGTDTDS